jgi:ferric-dicitrate binding protein FerR (iron transport regulator)
MSSEICRRVRDAAAFDDGRVWGDAAVLEHANDCEVCGRELRARKERRAFRDAFPVLTAIASESRRSPTRPRAGASDAHRHRARWRHFYVMLAAIVAVVGFMIQNGSFRARSIQPAGDEIVVPDPPFFRISNIENALFESKAEGGTVRSSMTRGVAAFHVERMRPGQRFFLALPDGDIEVRGTRFVVSVDGGKTRSVEVSEGTVAFRLQGRSEILLRSGQSWPEARPGRPTLSFLAVVPPNDASPPEPSQPND